MIQRFAIKLGTKVISQLGDIPKTTVKFDNENEAVDFVHFVEHANPKSTDDLEKYQAIIDSIIHPELEEELSTRKEESVLKTFYEDVSSADKRLSFTNGCMYFKDTKQLTIPKVIADEIALRASKGLPLEPIFNFWRLTALNPNPEAREGLFRFITDLDLTVTEEGLFVAYRNVINLTNMDLEEVSEIGKLWSKAARKNKDISETMVYNIELTYEDEKNDDTAHITQMVTSDVEIDNNEKWKDLPKDVRKQFRKTISEYGKDFTFTVTMVGSLQEVYMELMQARGTQLKMTDARTKTMSILLGVPVKLDRNQCDPNPNISCSRGLHVGSEKFVRRGNFGNFGIAVLVNPKDVVAVPHEYGTGYKMRCCAYLPMNIVDYTKEGALVPMEHKTLKITALKYLDAELDILSELANNEYADAIIHKYLPEHFNWIDTKGLINSIRADIENRVINM